MSSRKMAKSPPSAPDLDILGDQITLHPGGYVEPQSSKYDAQERNLVEHMARFRESPFDFLREVTLHVSGTGWRAYDDIIGQRILQGLHGAYEGRRAENADAEQPYSNAGPAKGRS